MAREQWKGMVGSDEKIASLVVRQGTDINGSIAPEQARTTDRMEAALAMFKNGLTPASSYETTPPLPGGSPSNGKGGFGRGGGN